MRRAGWLLVTLALAGCATTFKPRWVDDARLAWDAAKYPDDAAVVLFRADRTQLLEDGSNAVTRRTRHEVIAVQGEGAFWLAEVKVPFRAVDTLLEFSARLVQPDGSRQEFDARGFLGTKAGRGERDANASVFRFPNVKVGSVLEYRWVIESENFWNADSQDTLGRYPVKHYEFELTASKPLVLETLASNTTTPISVRTAGNGEHSLQFTLDDLPAMASVDFAPHWTFTEPRWAWRVLGYKDRAVTYDWLREWHDVVDSQGAKLFTDEKLTEGFAAKVDVSGCADVRCKVARALVPVREATHTRGVASRRLEPLAKVWSSGAASTTERALMLKVLLEREGLETWLAYGTDFLSWQPSPTFPNFEQFNHLFVYLPAQAGLPAPLVVDAACDTCAVGQLTPRNAGQPLYVFRTTSTLGRSTTEGRWVRPEAETAPGSLFRLAHRARVGADGTLFDEVALEARGREAESSLERFERRAHKLDDDERGAWRRANPLAALRSAKHEACARLAGRCAWRDEVEFPLQATRDGERWLVHLGFLRASRDTLFDAPDREVDVHFSWDAEAVEEVLELTAPEGTALEAVPAPVRREAGPMRAEVRVERTPGGAKVTRRLSWTLGVVRRAEYADLRAVADVFKQARRQVLVFSPVAGATPGAPAPQR